MYLEDKLSRRCDARHATKHHKMVFKHEPNPLAGSRWAFRIGNYIKKRYFSAVDSFKKMQRAYFLREQLQIF